MISMRSESTVGGIDCYSCFKALKTSTLLLKKWVPILSFKILNSSCMDWVRKLNRFPLAGTYLTRFDNRIFFVWTCRKWNIAEKAKRQNKGKIYTKKGNTIRCCHFGLRIVINLFEAYLTLEAKFTFFIVTTFIG